MKRLNNDVSFSKKFAHFMKHYFGYLLLALTCAAITVVLVSLCAL